MAESVQAEVLAGKETIAEYIGLDPTLLGVRKAVNDVLWACSAKEPLFHILCESVQALAMFSGDEIQCWS